MSEVWFIKFWDFVFLTINLNIHEILLCEIITLLSFDLVLDGEFKKLKVLLDP